MKKTLPALLTSLFLFQIIHSQTTEKTGKPIAEIFTDFHVNLDDTTKTTGFGLSRAFFGYNFFPIDNFSASFILNIGNPDDLTASSVRRRYAYFREASISYSKDKLNISFGITSTRHFYYQQKFWGKRYIANTFEALNGYGSVADLGIVMDYEFNDILKGDITVMNGEGYSELQLDNGVKTSAGITITPLKQLIIRFYGDYARQNGVRQYTLVEFAGIKNELITFGAEASYKTNLDLLDGHDSWGISATGSISVFKKAEIFARYDYSCSVGRLGESNHWNYLKDGSFFILGVQYSFSQDVKIALDYQGTYPNDRNERSTDMIYINALFKF